MARFLFFGRIRERVGAAQLDIELPENSLAEDKLRSWLDAELSLDGELLKPEIRMVVNENLSSAEQMITNLDEVALLPPVSGG